MTAPNDVRDILRASTDVLSLVQADHIKSFNLPEELQKDTDNIVVLIIEVSNPFNRFSSNHAQGRRSTVQIQAWFSSDSDIDGFQETVNQVLEDQEWFNSVELGLDTDPDTLQQFWTTEYTKQIKK